MQVSKMVAPMGERIRSIDGSEGHLAPHVKPMRVFFKRVRLNNTARGLIFIWATLTQTHSNRALCM